MGSTPLDEGRGRVRRGERSDDANDQLTTGKKMACERTRSGRDADMLVRRMAHAWLCMLMASFMSVHHTIHMRLLIRNGTNRP